MRPFDAKLANELYEELIHIVYHNCHNKMAEPRQNPTAVSPARIGVLTALIPMPK
jgi:hypothetical protein